MARNRFLQELVDCSMYDSVSYTGDTWSIFSRIVDGQDVAQEYAADLFCAACREPSTFNPSIEKVAFKANRNPLPSLSDAFYNGLVNTADIVLRCSRNREHYLSLQFIHVKKSALTKIGQYPSHADIEFPGLDKYHSILPSDLHRDLKKANGLVSHGVGAGSLVYLRRIFEHLLEEAKQRAIEENAAFPEDFEKLRVLEKIVALKGYLPELMVKNKEAYSLLSKGVHELTEDECLQMFPVLNASIELILDELLEKRERAQKESLISSAISDLHAKHKAAEKGGG